MALTKKQKEILKAFMEALYQAKVDNYNELKPEAVRSNKKAIQSASEELTNDPEVIAIVNEKKD